MRQCWTGKAGADPWRLAECLSKCLECGACAASCPSGVDTPEAVLAMRQELRRVGSHPGSQPRGLRGYLPRDLGCCGLPFRSLGDEDPAARLMDKCLRQLSITGADGIFIVCSSCAFAFRQAGKRTSGPTAILDIHELLVKIGAMTAPPDSPVAGKVTWHGPCHLGRGLGVTREPREIIAGLPGVEYVEAGELSSCGGGGVFSLTHYGLALKIGASRAKELAASGASVVATGCPSCRMHLEDMLGRLGSPIKVVHTVELLDGITPPTFRKKAKVFTANALP